MSESKLADYVVNNLDHVGHWSRVESHSTSSGIPDLNFCINGLEGWLELKHGTLRKPPTLRPTQCAWFRRRVQAGHGNPKLLVKIESKYGLMCGAEVPVLIHAKTGMDWLRPCVKIWDGRIEWDQLIHLITAQDT